MAYGVKILERVKHLPKHLETDEIVALNIDELEHLILLHMVDIYLALAQ